MTAAPPDPTEPAPGPLPGLVLAGAVMLVATWSAGHVGAALLAAQGVAGGRSPVSSITVAVLLGLILANTVGVPERCRPGLALAMKQVLKAGIVLVGLKLSLVDVVQLGLAGIPVVACVVVVAMLWTQLLSRWISVSANLQTLAAASTAICGVTATVAVAGVIQAEDDEVAYTVANVTLFGLLAMLVYPYLAHLAFAGGSASAGLFLGTAIHDTSQVMGAAMAYRELFQDEVAFQVATVTKLTRNVFLVGVVPFMAWRHASEDVARSVRARDHFPLFVLGFLAMALVRTAGDVGLSSGGAALGLFSAAQWKAGLAWCTGTVATGALATALAAVGLQTRLATLVRLGWRPMALGAGAALGVGVTALGLARVVGPMLHAGS